MLVGSVILARLAAERTIDIISLHFLRFHQANLTIKDAKRMPEENFARSAFFAVKARICSFTYSATTAQLLLADPLAQVPNRR